MNRTSKMVINMENTALTHEHLPRSQNIFHINMENNALTHEHLPRSQNMGLGGGASIYMYTYIRV